MAFYRKLLAFRAGHPAFAKGDLQVFDASATHIALRRSYQGQLIHCLFNLSDKEQVFDAPAGHWRTDDAAPFAIATGQTLTLPPYQAWFGLSDS